MWVIDLCTGWTTALHDDDDDDHDDDDDSGGDDNDDDVEVHDNVIDNLDNEKTITLFCDLIFRNKAL